MNRNYQLLLLLLGLDKELEKAIQVRVKKTLKAQFELSLFRITGYKIMFFLRVLLIPFKVMTIKKTIQLNRFMGYSREDGNIWRYFIKHYFKEDASYLDRDKINIKSFSYELIILYFKFIMFAIFWKPKIKENWILHLFEILFLGVGNKKFYKKVYSFYINHPSSLVFSKYLEDQLNKEVLIHLGNNPIMKWNNPLPLKSKFISSSIIQLDELKYLGKINEVIYCMDEFILYSKDVQPREPAIDIGFISSAEWAREKGLYRSNNIDDIRDYKLADNIIYRKFEEGLKEIIKISKANKLKVKVYPHPFERELISQGVFPPYYKWVKSGDISIDIGADSSREKIYEPKLAISYHSSFIWERLSLGLTSSYHFYFDDEEIDLVDLKALQQYENNLFKSNMDLCRLIEFTFNI